MDSKNEMHPEQKRITDEFLLAAVRDYEYERIKLCIIKGGDINARDRDGYTPLMIAVSKGSSNLVRAVLAQGPDLFIKSKGGHTAYDLIRSVSSTDARKAITDIMLGALPDHMRSQVETPEDVAALAANTNTAQKGAITAPKTASFNHKDKPPGVSGEPKKGFSL